MDPCQQPSVEAEFWRATLLMLHGLSPSCFFLLWLPLLIFKIFVNPYYVLGFLGSSTGKESACNAGDPGLIPGLGRSPGEGICHPFQYSWSFLVAQVLKNLPAMWENWFQSLGWEIPWRRAWQPTPVFLPGEFPWTEEPGGYMFMGS